MEEFATNVDENKKNPISKYDAAITKTSYFNDTLAKQVSSFVKHNIIIRCLSLAMSIIGMRIERKIKKFIAVSKAY